MTHRKSAHSASSPSDHWRNHGTCSPGNYAIHGFLTMPSTVNDDQDDGYGTPIEAADVAEFEADDHLGVQQLNEKRKATLLASSPGGVKRARTMTRVSPVAGMRTIRAVTRAGGKVTTSSSSITATLATPVTPAGPAFSPAVGPASSPSSTIPQLATPAVDNASSGVAPPTPATGTSTFQERLATLQVALPCVVDTTVHVQAGGVFLQACLHPQQALAVETLVKFLIG
ncbi:Nn.00g112830.m01.CDS01 [Neocucurbitaria sp. VM-36]